MHEFLLSLYSCSCFFHFSLASMVTMVTIGNVVMTYEINVATLPRYSFLKTVLSQTHKDGHDRTCCSKQFQIYKCTCNGKCFRSFLIQADPSGCCTHLMQGLQCYHNLTDVDADLVFVEMFPLVEMCEHFTAVHIV